MGGKSTLMRETAVLAILAHVVRENSKDMIARWKSMCCFFLLGKLCPSKIMCDECL